MPSYKTRNPGVLLFADEMRSTELQLKGEGEQDPSYLISPTGAKANRVFFCGTATEVENLAEEGREPYWRLKVVDPTGEWFVYAGKYNPDAAGVMRDLMLPRFVAVMAKTGIYETDEGVRMPTLRAEMVQVITAEDRDIWIAQAVKATLNRIDAFMEIIRTMEGGGAGFDTADEVDGKAPIDADSILKAIGYYATDRDDLNHWKKMVKRAVASLQSEKPEKPKPGRRPVDGHEPKGETYYTGSDGKRKRMLKMEEVPL